MPKPAFATEKTRVVIIRTDDRIEGVKAAMAQFDLSGFKGASVAIKANYNSADPFPASTHPNTLKTMTLGLKDAGAGPMTLVERSGMGDTASVLREMGAENVASEVEFDVVVMDALGPDGYVHKIPACTHWKQGILVERHFMEADKVVQTCCLKTHQYGGHFTLSLKNAVGAIAKFDPETGYNYMTELHRSPLQRTLIAEISQVFRNDLIIMDGLKAFVTGGPHRGRKSPRRHRRRHRPGCRGRSGGGHSAHVRHHSGGLRRSHFRPGTDQPGISRPSRRGRTTGHRTRPNGGRSRRVR